MSDSIDAELLDYYQRELTWLRHAGAGFAQRHPKVEYKCWRKGLKNISLGMMSRKRVEHRI